MLKEENAELIIDGKLYGKDEVVKTIHTGVDGIASTASDTLPYGTYRIDETKAPEAVSYTHLDMECNKNIGFVS